jgi:hypothetical protein
VSGHTATLFPETLTVYTSCVDRGICIHRCQCLNTKAVVPLVGAMRLLLESRQILCHCHVLLNYAQLINRGCELDILTAYTCSCASILRSWQSVRYFVTIAALARLLNVFLLSRRKLCIRLTGSKVLNAASH